MLNSLNNFKFLEYNKWTEKCNLIFKNMNIELPKIIIYCDKIYDNKLSVNSTGKYIGKNRFNIHEFIIRTNLNYEAFIITYSHEIGHMSQILGYAESKNYYKRILSESVAFKFEEKFLIEYNLYHNENILINNSDFSKSCFFDAHRLAYLYGKNIVSLKTKNEFKINIENYKNKSSL